MADRNPKPKIEVEVNPVKKNRTYLCPNRSGQTFYIPVRDEKGNKIPKTNALGQPMFNGNKPVFLEVMLKFNPIPTKQGQPAICSYELEKEDPLYDDKYKALESMRQDGTSWVMNKEDFEKWRNPDAAEFKIENARLRTESEEKDKTIEAMRKQIAELQVANKPKG